MWVLRRRRAIGVADRPAATMGASRSAAGGAPPLVELRGISKAFGATVANRRVDLSVEAGEVHALLGENGAGKTTLMKVLFGLVRPDEGEVLVRGRRAHLHSPADAAALGIGMVHQHFMLVPDMTVAENVALGARHGLLHRLQLDALVEELEQLCEDYGLELDPRATIEGLSVGMRQRAEILKLLYRGAEIVVLDEPTAVLTGSEWERLKDVLHRMTAEGHAVIFISHKLHEIAAVADRCTVMRDGAVIGTVARQDLEERTLARMMVGREVVLRVPWVPVPPGAPVLEVANATVAGPARPLLDDVSFTVREGEIFGIAGVDGNGQAELFEVLVGLRPSSSGSVRICGDEPRRGSPREFMLRSGGAVPEDRQAAGLALDLTVAENLVLSDLCQGRFVRHGFVDHAAIARHGEALLRDYEVDPRVLHTPVRHLSGGNQQRIVLARVLHGHPRVLVASQPTRGLDVGAMEFVYRHLLDLKRAGSGIVLISSELEEILSLADRIAVLVQGRFAGLLDRDHADAETLGLLMSGGKAAA